MNSIATPEWPVLIVDDEPNALRSTERILVSSGFNNILSCSDPREVAGILEKTEISIILLDLSMPHITGDDLLPEIVAARPEVPVIIVTGANEVDTAVHCMRAGAFDYMVKPVEKSRMLSGVHRAIELRELRHENEDIRDRMLSGVVRRPEAFEGIITNNEGMYALFRYCESVAGSQWPVLITGETGVGKELLALAVHRLSDRTGDFVAVNAAGLDDGVFSDTLFGHIRGAYTGADETRKGLIEQAAAGTLFLDEIGDLTSASQVKLLRVIQEHEYYPMGSDIAKRTNARIVFATNRNLNALQAEGTFRKDLYHRLKTHHVHIPPLRKRLDDLPLLVDHFLDKASTALDKKRPSHPKELYALLATYSFPGNIRELEGMVFDAVANHGSRMLSMESFAERISQSQTESENAPAPTDGTSLYALFDRLPTLKESAAMLIEEAMRRAEGNQTLAARLLGISRTGLNKRLHQEADADPTQE
jgi:DNA-binding NtrC family response regulator